MNEKKIETLFEKITSACPVDGVLAFIVPAVFREELPSSQIEILERYHILEEVKKLRDIFLSDEFRISNPDEYNQLKELITDPTYQVVENYCVDLFIEEEKKFREMNEIDIAIFFTEALAITPSFSEIFKSETNFDYSPTLFRPSESDKYRKLILELAQLLTAQGYTRKNNLSDFHRDILIYLASGKPPKCAEPQPPLLPANKILKPVDAIKEIENLNVPQVSLLQNCYHSGLRGNDLRSWQPGPEGKFLPAHEAAAELLINGTSPQDAIRNINGLSEKEAWDLTLEIRHTQNRRATL